MSNSFERDPFQRLSVGDAMNRAFSLLFKRKDVFLPIGAICWIPILALTATAVHFTGSSLAALSQSSNQDEQYYSDNKDTTELQENMDTFLLQFIIEFFLLEIVIILAKGAIVYTVTAMYAQEQPTLGLSLRQGCSRWCDLFLTGCLVGIVLLLCHLIVAGVVLGISALGDSIVPKILIVVIYLVYLCFLVYIGVSLILLTSVIMVERKTTSSCIWRCMELAKGNRCFIFCTVFCIALANAFVQTILGLILFAIREDGKDVITNSPFLYVTVTTLTTCLYIPLMNILEAVVYFSIRVEKEGMSLEVLKGEMSKFVEPMTDLSAEVV